MLTTIICLSVSCIVLHNMLHNEGEQRQTIQNVLRTSGMKEHYKCPKPVSHKLLSQGYLASLLSVHLVVLAMYIIGGSASVSASSTLEPFLVNTKGT